MNTFVVTNVVINAIVFFVVLWRFTRLFNKFKITRFLKQYIKGWKSDEQNLNIVKRINELIIVNDNWDYIKNDTRNVLFNLYNVDSSLLSDEHIERIYHVLLHFLLTGTVNSEKKLLENELFETICDGIDLPTACIILGQFLGLETMNISTKNAYVTNSGLKQIISAIPTIYFDSTIEEISNVANSVLCSMMLSHLTNDDDWVSTESGLPNLFGKYTIIKNDNITDHLMMKLKYGGWSMKSFKEKILNNEIIPFPIGY